MGIDREYGFDRVEASWTTPLGALDLKEGVSVDGSISEAQTGASWALRSDGQGGALYTKLVDGTGQLTVTLEQESAANQKLMARYNADLVTGGVVGPIVITDNSNGDVIVYNNARIMQRPNVVRGVSAVQNAWLFGYASAQYYPGDPNKNLVGA